MSFYYIDTKNLKNKPKFSLCLPLPLRNKINNLVDIDNINLKMNLGKVHELSFDMPYYVERDHELIKNPLIDKFQAYYQVKMEWNGIVEYFVYINGNRKLDSSGATISYKLYSSAYLLSKKILRSYEETSRTLSYHAREMLSDFPDWKVDYVDAEFDLKYRTIEISESTVLQSLYDLAIKFNALIIFDNVNLTVSFFQPQNIGHNKGITFKPTTFIETLGQTIDYDSIVTRLYVYGSDGLEFRRLSPTGSNYIESLDWFIYPYEEDSNGNVKKHSKWLTDGLCKAYIAYQNKLESVTPTFKTLTNQTTDLQDDIIQLEQELSVLEAELKQIEDELWVINKTYMDEAPERADWQSAVNRKNAKNTQINSKKNQITNVETQLENVQTQIANLRWNIAVDNPVNFTSEQIIEMSNFIHQKTLTNDSITEEQDLLDFATDSFAEVGMPPITIDMSVVNFLNEIEYKLIHDRITLGDIVKVKSKEIDVHVSLKIIEINYNISNDNLSLTISNVENLRDDMADLVDKIYTASNTSTTVNMDKYKWNLGEEANTTVNQILNNAWDAAKQAIFGGYKNTTLLDEWGLKSVETGDPNTFLIINNGVMALSSDGGNSISVAITKDGVHAERLVGKIIIGEKLVIEDEKGVWETHGSTTVVYDQHKDPRMWIGQLSPNCFGIRMDNSKHRINLSTCDGFRISKYNGGSLEDVMYADLEGNLWSKYWTHDTTNIKDSQNYFSLNDNKIVIKDGSNEIMRMGYIPSMSFGGCSIGSDWGVVLKGQNDSLIFMTKNRGFAIDVDCVPKFHVTTQGNLYAQDIEANNLMIKTAKIGSSILIDENTGISMVGDKGINITGTGGITVTGSKGIVKMNADDGFKINNGTHDVFYVGTDGKLYLRNVYTLNEDGSVVEDIDGSFISDLTVNRLKTLTETNRENFVHIEDTYIKFKTEDRTKLAIKFYGSGEDAFPQIEWGEGDDSGNARAIQYKDESSFVTEYIGSDGDSRKIELTDYNNKGVLITSPYGVTFDLDGGFEVEISPDGIFANGDLVVEF